MTEQEFIDAFADLVEAEEPESLSLDTRFRELDEWSSLAGLSVLEYVEKNFGKKIEVPVFKQQRTIGDLYRLIG